MTENDVTAQILAGAEQIKAGGASKPARAVTRSTCR